MVLDYLALKYDTDKSSRSHGYTTIYEQFLEPIRHNVSSMLEIGIGDGQSIKMWEEYFPNATIYGLDMNGFTPRFPLRSSTTVYQFCQSDQEKLRETFSDKKLEIIVDDASHDEDK